MHVLLLLVFSLLTLPAFAQSEDKDAQMVRLLTENKVEPWGKRKIQEASITCGNSKKKKKIEFSCTIIVEGPWNELPLVYEKITGEKAVEVSRLLKEFGVEPEGRRDYQKADIRCRLASKNSTNPPYCSLIPSDMFCLM